MTIGIIGKGVMAKILKNNLDNMKISNVYIADINKYDNIDVIIDFSSPYLLDETIKLVSLHKIPIVICTTGYSNEDELLINKLAQEVPIIYSKNTSLGIAVLNHIVKETSKLLPGYDIEIIEKHHNNKVDAPSGTAKLLLESIIKIRDNLRSKFNRSEELKKRDCNEIGIHTIRGGSIVGEHSVLFIGQGEVIELKHEAISKDLFAQGAIKCAMYLNDIEKNGMYSMEDVLNIK